jgi:hypothetical protein
MHRRDATLEAWEYRALQEYATWRGGRRSAQQLGALLQAQRWARYAQALLHSGTAAARDAAYGWDAPPASCRAGALRSPTRLEYRLVALFAE